MSLWKYVATAVVATAMGASGAVGTIYLAADEVLGDQIDERVTPIVSHNIDAAIRQEQEETLVPVLKELTRQTNARLDALEQREYELDTGISCGSSYDQPLVLTRLGRSEPVCVVEVP